MKTLSNSLTLAFAMTAVVLGTAGPARCEYGWNDSGLSPHEAYVQASGSLQAQTDFAVRWAANFAHCEVPMIQRLLDKGDEAGARRLVDRDQSTLRLFHRIIDRKLAQFSPSYGTGTTSTMTSDNGTDRIVFIRSGYGTEVQDACDDASARLNDTLPL